MPRSLFAAGLGVTRSGDAQPRRCGLDGPAGAVIEAADPDELSVAARGALNICATVGATCRRQTYAVV